MSDEVRKKSQYHEKLKQRNSQDRAPVYRERNHRTPRHPRRTELRLQLECGMLSWCATRIRNCSMLNRQHPDNLTFNIQHLTLNETNNPSSPTNHITPLPTGEWPGERLLRDNWVGGKC